MDKSQSELREQMFDVLNCYQIDASEVSDGMTYIGSDEASKILDEIMPLIKSRAHNSLYIKRSVVKERVMGAIGEDETPLHQPFSRAVASEGDKITRNELRAQQRQALTKVLEEE